MGEVKIKTCQHPGGVHRNPTSHLVAEVDYFLENNPLNPSKQGLGPILEKMPIILPSSQINIISYLSPEGFRFIMLFSFPIFYCQAQLSGYVFS